MPIHQYQCPICNEKFEDITLKMSEAEKTKKCPNCGAPVTRNVSSGAFIVHGYNSANGYAGHMR